MRVLCRETEASPKTGEWLGSNQQPNPLPSVCVLEHAQTKVIKRISQATWHENSRGNIQHPRGRAACCVYSQLLLFLAYNFRGPHLIFGWAERQTDRQIDWLGRLKVRTTATWQCCQFYFKVVAYATFTWDFYELHSVSQYVFDEIPINLKAAELTWWSLHVFHLANQVEVVLDNVEFIKVKDIEAGNWVKAWAQLNKLNANYKFVPKIKLNYATVNENDDNSINDSNKAQVQ